MTEDADQTALDMDPTKVGLTSEETKTRDRTIANRHIDRELIIMIRAGDDRALSQLISKYEKFAERSAWAFAEWTRTHHLFDDLLQHSRIGIFLAAKKFDPNLGYAFLTFAVWWMRSEMNMFLRNHSRTVRIPCFLWDRGNRIRKKAESEGDYCLTEEERWLLAILYSHELRLESGPTDVRCGLSSSQGPEESLIEFIDQKRRTEEFETEMARLLTGMELAVIKHRHKGATLNETAELLFKEKLSRWVLTGERVRQIETRARRRLSLAMSAN